MLILKEMLRSIAIKNEVKVVMLSDPQNVYSELMVLFEGTVEGAFFSYLSEEDGYIVDHISVEEDTLILRVIEPIE